MKEFYVKYTKKRRQIKCNNYRPITLLNIAHKITAILCIIK